MCVLVAAAFPQAVFVDSDGTVLYGSNCSIGLLTTDNTLVLPPDEDGLANFGVQELAAHTLEVRGVGFRGLLGGSHS